jgi:hypothetical protein
MTVTEIHILGILVTNRENESENVQRILTKYGCSIKTRLGLHEDETGSNSCGLIVLELTGETSEMDKLENELKGVEALQISKMVFPV